MLRTSLVIAIGVFAACLAPLAAMAQTAEADAEPGKTLRVVVSGVPTSAGHVRVDVCDATDFLKECRLGAAAPANPGETVVLVPDVPPGDYAVTAYHDGNDNHSVDRNRLGIPTEGVGFSNDPPVRFRAPSFRAAAFSYDGGVKTVTVRLRHFTH